MTVDGVPDDLWFDYRYDNGRSHLMQRVGLANSDKNTWDRLHLVETNFERLALEQGSARFQRNHFYQAE